jgi:hypothetical protein
MNCKKKTNTADCIVMGPCIIVSSASCKISLHLHLHRAIKKSTWNSLFQPQNQTQCDVVTRCRCDKKTYKDGSNFLSDQLGRSRNIIILKEMNIMLDILDSKRQSNPHAEGTVIVHVNDGELVEDDASSLDEG